MKRAYRYARYNEPPPPELEVKAAVREYGAAAVYGRTLGVREMRRMNLAERVARVTRDLYRSTDWGKWQARHPEDYAFLLWVMKVADGNHQDSV